MSQQDCEGRGCCWRTAEFPGAPHVDLPWCFQPNAGRSDYRATDVQEGKGACWGAGIFGAAGSNAPGSSTQSSSVPGGPGRQSGSQAGSARKLKLHEHPPSWCRCRCHCCCRRQRACHTGDAHQHSARAGPRHRGALHASVLPLFHCLHKPTRGITAVALPPHLGHPPIPQSASSRNPCCCRSPRSLAPSPQVLKLEAEPLTDAILRLRITDAHAQRWEVPQWLLKSELLPGGNRRRQPGAAPKGGIARGAPQYSQYKLAVKQEPFSLEVSRPEEAQRPQQAAAGQPGAPGDSSSGGGTLFNTTGLRLVFKASPARSSGGPESQPGARGLQPGGCHRCR